MAPCRRHEADRSSLPTIRPTLTVRTLREGENGVMTVDLEELVRLRTRELEARNRELEEARKAADNANRLKSEFLANTSHELRTPLNAIMGLLRLVQDGLCVDRREEMEFICQAHGSAQKLLTLINDLLDLSNLEAGKFRVDLEPVNIRGLFDSLREQAVPLAEQKGLALTFEIASEQGDVLACADSMPDVVVRADEARLRQVLLNLIGNAIKFTHKGGVVMRALPRPAKGYVAIEVRDTGIGVAPERQAKLFIPFVQADGSATRKFNGTGLGLAVSRKLVELMGGTLRLFSEGDAKGATLTLTVPFHSSDQAGRDHGTRSEAAPDHQGPLALVVDDDTVVRAVLERMLRLQGYRTMGKETADAALTVLALEAPAVITLDIGLPSNPGAQLKTGWDLLRVIDEWATSHPEAHRPVVVIASGLDGEVARRLEEEPFLCAPRILPKPFTAQQFAAIIPPAALSEGVCSGKRQA